MDITVQYCSTNGVTWAAVFCGQSSTCLQAGFRKGQTIPLCYISSFQVHNLPSCPVLKSFQQTVERRSVDSMLFILEDSSRWLPVSMPLASGAVLPRVDVLHQLTSADRSAFPSAAVLHQSPLMRFVPQPSQCKVQCLESVPWPRKKECTLRRPGCGLAPCFVDPHEEGGLAGAAVSHWGGLWRPQLPQGFQWTSGKSKSRREEMFPAHALRPPLQLHKYSPNSSLGSLCQGWHLHSSAEKCWC